MVFSQFSQFVGGFSPIFIVNFIAISTNLLKVYSYDYLLEWSSNFEKKTLTEGHKEEKWETF
jgi:hypothetical protein